MQFVFHADGGRVIGAAAYPLASGERFSFARAGSLVSLNGPVRWFASSSFVPLEPGAASRHAAAQRGGACAGGGASLALGCLASAAVVRVPSIATAPR